ncbi:MAG: hypothetical protein ACI9HE_003024 [Planctomycetota bacterium]|jgi:hypothetical protein
MQPSGHASGGYEDPYREDSCARLRSGLLTRDSNPEAPLPAPVKEQWLLAIELSLTAAGP